MRHVKLTRSRRHFIHHCIIYAADNFLHGIVHLQLVKKLAAFFGTRRFITVFTRGRYAVDKMQLNSCHPD